MSVSRPDYPIPGKPGKFLEIEMELSQAVRMVGWEPRDLVDVGRWGRILVWKIFGGRMEVSTLLKHGTYYMKHSKPVNLDILTNDEWVIDVKTGKSRMPFRQVERYSRARVEGRYKGIFAVFVQNPLSHIVGPTENDLRLMEKFSWPYGRVVIRD